MDAALELLATLHTLNQERQKKDANQKPYEGGCGIATGDAVCGNLGSLERMVYTAIGETVNIASRLEGQNKLLNSQLVLSETTYQRLHNPPSCQKTEVKIDSREQPIPVYYYSASQ